MHISIHLPVLLFSTLTLPIFAQSGAFMEGASAYAAPPMEAKVNLPAHAPLRAANPCKRLSQSYSGYAIEVSTSKYPLQAGEPVFRQFGNLHYEKRREGGYSYLIKGEFSSKKAALHFLDNIIRPRVPGASLFLYEEGNRRAVTK